MTLVIVVGMTGIWIRTFGGHDVIELHLHRSAYSLVSSTDGVWIGPPGDEIPHAGFSVQWQEYRRDTVSPPMDVIQIDEFRPLILISHVFVVLPLTMLSAYLILWPGKREIAKPRTESNVSTSNSQS